MGLLDALPSPKASLDGPTSAPRVSFQALSSEARPQISNAPDASGPPAYGKRGKGSGFIPKTEEDFADGGAFPEVSVLQYPLTMGRRSKKPASRVLNSRKLATKVGPNGEVDYSAVVKQGIGKGVVVHSGYEAVVEKARSSGIIERPSEQERMETIQKTRQALEQRVDGKIAAAQPKNFRGAGDERKATYIKYTAANADPTHNSGAEQRIIKMVEAPVDPLEPPKFKQHKAPPAPPSPPAPVMHSPARKVTKEEAAEWKIPPCISNWKNIKGYTIPLDKRLAADGRGLQDTRINDKFAQMAESLYIAERTSREEVEKRAQIQRHIATKEKEEKEKELRDLAALARAERAGIRGDPEAGPSQTLKPHNASPPSSPGQGRTRAIIPENPSDEEINEEDLAAARSRDQIRAERRRERERDLRMREREEESGNAKRSKLQRDRDRDFSERVALGQTAGVAPAGNAEVMYDQRLFNQEAGGMNGGMGAADSYNIYEKPLFSTGNSSFLYKAKKTDGGDVAEPRTGRFKADKGFGGTVPDSRQGEPAGRSKPVEFEKDVGTSIRAQDGARDDPFGLDKFLTDAKNAKGKSERMDDALQDKRGRSMLGGASSAAGLRESGPSQGRTYFRRREAE